MAFVDLDEDLDLEFEEEGTAPNKRPVEEATPSVSRAEGTLEFKVDIDSLKAASAKTSSLPETQILPNPLVQNAPEPQKKPEATRTGIVTPLKKPEATSSKIKPERTKPAIEKTETQILREQLRQTQFNADVNKAAAEFKIQLLGEVLGDMKLLEHQVNQILARISVKHPDVKQEALLIKKILADFTLKKRK